MSGKIGAEMSKAQHEEITTLLKEVVEAANRTNHAVRAIVRPIYIQLVTTLLLLPLLLIYAFEQSLGLLIVIGLVALVGAVVAIGALVSELSLSKVPYSFRSELLRMYESAEDAEDDEPVDVEQIEKSLTTNQAVLWRMTGKPDLRTWREGTFDDWINKQV